MEDQVLESAMESDPFDGLYIPVRERREQGCDDILCDWTPLSGCRPCQEPGEYPCHRICCDG